MRIFCLGHECRAGAASKRRVGVEDKLPFDFGQLGRTVERIAEDDHPLVSARKNHTGMSRGVPGSGPRRDPGEQSNGVTVDEFDALGHHLKRGGSASPAASVTGIVVPVGFAHVNGGIREGDLTILFEPTAMIAVEMRDDDSGHVLRRDPYRLEVGQHGAAVEHLISYDASPGVDEKYFFTHSDHEAADWHQHLATFTQEMLVAGPVGRPTGGREHLRGKKRSAVVDGLDHQRADMKGFHERQSVAGPACSSSSFCVGPTGRVTAVTNTGLVVVASLVADLAAELAGVADPSKSEPMRAYMKNDFVFLGVPAPVRRAALRTVFARHRLSARRSVPVDWLTELSHGLAKGPSREAQYLAGDVLVVFGRSVVPEMLTTIVDPVFSTTDATLGGWWDLVDHYVGCLVAPLGSRFDIAATMRLWLHGSGVPIHRRAEGPFSAELAKVRIAILSQLGRKASTDETLLLEFCAHRGADREFFVAKAVGWALRDYSYAAPNSVRLFVTSHPELTKLAAGEALKAVNRQTK